MKTPNYWIMPMLKGKHEPQFLIDSVCEYFGLASHEVKSENRERKLVNARFISIALIRELNSDLTLKEIGKYLGGKHYSSIIHATQKHRDFIDYDVDYKTHYSKIKNRLFMNKPNYAEKFNQLKEAI